MPGNLLVSKNTNLRQTNQASPGTESDAATRGVLRCATPPSRNSAPMLAGSRLQRGDPHAATAPASTRVPPTMRRQVFGVTCWWPIADAGLPDHRLSTPDRFAEITDPQDGLRLGNVGRGSVISTMWGVAAERRMVKRQTSSAARTQRPRTRGPQRLGRGVVM